MKCLAGAIGGRNPQHYPANFRSLCAAPRIIFEGQDFGRFKPPILLLEEIHPALLAPQQAGDRLVSILLSQIGSCQTGIVLDGDECIPGWGKAGAGQLTGTWNLVLLILAVKLGKGLIDGDLVGKIGIQVLPEAAQTRIQRRTVGWNDPES